MGSIFNPKRWHIITWAIFCLWLLVAVLGNLPEDISFQDFTPPTQPETRSATDLTRVYTMSVEIGWPVAYLSYTCDPFSTAIVWKTNWLKLMANLVAILAVQTAIVYVFQQLKQFRIQHIMALSAMVALLVTLARSLGNLWDGWALYYLLHLIYFSPMIAAAAMAVPVWRIVRCGST